MRNNFLKTQFLGLLLVLTVLLTSSSSAWLNPVQAAPVAQAGADDWVDPLNLSQSGAATAPVMFIDPEGQFTVIWADLFSGYVYTRGDGSQWSEPQNIEFPFTRSKPKIFSGAENNVHALWLDEGRAGQGVYYSRVDMQYFDRLGAWLWSRNIAGPASVFDVTQDEAGRFHVIFLQPEDTRERPAGIYYVRSTPDGAAWSDPQPLYTSPYFRQENPEGGNLQIVAATTSTPAAPAEGEAVDATEEAALESRIHLYAVWDHPVLQRVFVAVSEDDGVTWGQPVEVARPSQTALTGGPANIRVAAHGDDAVLIWQGESSGISCTQYNQWSRDGGQTWQDRQRMLENLLGCPQDTQILVDDAGRFFLMTNLQGRTYLVAWDGSEWSRPQAQVELGSFVDPVTLLPVQLGCRQPLMLDHQLYIVGCDQASGKDIWITHRPLQDLSDWFSTGPEWSPTVGVASDGFTQVQAVLDPQLIADTQGRLHAIWSQPSSEDGPDGPGKGLYYARREGGMWSSPQIVLASPLGKAEQPALALDPENRLLVVWSGGDAGTIYFSQVRADRAALGGAAFSEPVQVSASNVGSWPVVAADPTSGRIYVAYAVPLNEQRGLYLTYSEDGGETWSPPEKIVDAIEQSWSMVDRPQLTVGEDGDLFLQWITYQLPTGAGPSLRAEPLGLYYARSQDGARTWSVPQQVTDRPTYWSRLVYLGNALLSRVWMERERGQTQIWHEQSSDGGLFWTRAEPISLFNNILGLPALAGDATGGLHLALAVDRGLGQPAILYWVWDGSGWVPSPMLEPQAVTLPEWTSMDAAISSDGELGLIFRAYPVDASTVPGAASAGLQGQENLFFSSLPLSLPAQPLAALPSPTPNPAAAQVTATPAPTPTETPIVPLQDVPLDQLSTEPQQSGNGLFDSLVGPIAAGMIVLVVFAVSARRMLSGK